MPVGEGFDLPPGSEPWSDFHWFSASVKGSRIFVVLSERPLWYTGHFVSGRMAPCTSPDCDMCSSGIGAQVRYIYAVGDTDSHRVGLLEMSKSNATMVNDWQSRDGGLRGLTIEISKHTKNIQSRTELRQAHKIESPWWRAMEVPDPSLALFLTWHKAGYKMPSDFVAAAQTKMAMKQKLLESKVTQRLIVDDSDSWTDGDRAIRGIHSHRREEGNRQG